MPKNKRPLETTRTSSRRQASKEALKQMQLLLDDEEEEDAFVIPDDDDDKDVRLEIPKKRAVSPIIEPPPKKKYKLSHRKSSDGNDRDVIVLKSISNFKYVPKENTLELECFVEELSDVQKERRKKVELEEKELQTKLEELMKGKNSEVVYQGEFNSAVEVNELISNCGKKQLFKPSQLPQLGSKGEESAPTYQLVMDPRLGIIVGTVQTNQTPPPMPPPPLIKSKIQLSSAVKAVASLPQNQTPTATRNMRTRRGAVSAPSTPLQTRGNNVIPNKGNNAIPTRNNAMPTRGNSATPTRGTNSTPTRSNATPPIATRGNAATPPIATRGNAATPPIATRGNSATPPIATRGNTSTPTIATRGSAATPTIATRGSAATPTIATRGSAATPTIATRGSAATPTIATRGSAATPPITTRGSAASPSISTRGSSATPSRGTTQNPSPTPPTVQTRGMKTPTVQTRNSKTTPASKRTVTNVSAEKTGKNVVDLTSDDSRNQVDNREIAFNKLQGKTYPSLVVVARPHLRVTDLGADRSKLDSKVKSVLMHPPTKFTEWLIQQGLIRAEQKCPVHTITQLKLGMYSDVSKFPFSGGYVWISECCPQRFISVFNGSIFEGSPNPPMVMLKLIYHWSCQTNIQNVTQWVKVDNLYVKGVYTWLRATCTVAVQTRIRQLGGPGSRIEVGVISLGTTSHDGNQRQVKVEVLGILESSSKFMRLRAVEPMPDGERNFRKKFSKILEPILLWVHPASTIVTDLTVDKSTLHQMGFTNVVQTTSNEYNNSNRTIMEYLRRIVPRMFQNTLSLLSRQIIQQFLDELVWREWFGITAQQAFDNIIAHLAEQTRTNTQPSLIIKLNKVAANPFRAWNNASGAAPVVTSTPTPVTTKETPSTPAVTPAKTPVSEVKRYGRGRKSNSPQVPAVQERPTKPVSPDVPEQMVPLENYYYGTIDSFETPPTKVTLSMKCPFCKSTFDNNLQLQNHLFKHAHNVSNDAYLCRYCLTSVSTANELLYHINKFHPGETKFDNGFVCLICETHYMNPFVLGKHMSKEHSPHELPYECGSCTFRCSNHKQIIDHFYVKHDGGTTIQCPFCLKSTTIWSGGRNIAQNMHYFIQHLQKHQKKQLAKRCGKCNLWFVQKEVLKDHQQKMHASLRGRLGLVPSSSPRNGVMVPKSKMDKNPCDAEIINFSSVYYNIPNNSLCKECDQVISSPKHFPSFDSCQNPNCQYSTCCATAMMTHNAKCKGLNSVIPPETLPFEMFCVCGHKDLDGNSMAKHLATCEKKSAYPSQAEAKSATVMHSMLDILGLVRKPEEAPPSKMKENPETPEDSLKLKQPINRENMAKKSGKPENQNEVSVLSDDEETDVDKIDSDKDISEKINSNKNVDNTDTEKGVNEIDSLKKDKELDSEQVSDEVNADEIVKEVVSEIKTIGDDTLTSEQAEVVELDEDDPMEDNVSTFKKANSEEPNEDVPMVDISSKEESSFNEVSEENIDKNETVIKETDMSPEKVDAETTDNLKCIDIGSAKDSLEDSLKENEVNHNSESETESKEPKPEDEDKSVDNMDASIGNSDASFGDKDHKIEDGKPKQHQFCRIEAGGNEALHEKGSYKEEELNEELTQTDSSVLEKDNEGDKDSLEDDSEIAEDKDESKLTENEDESENIESEKGNESFEVDLQKYNETNEIVESESRIENERDEIVENQTKEIEEHESKEIEEHESKEIEEHKSKEIEKHESRKIEEHESKIIEEHEMEENVPDENIENEAEEIIENETEEAFVNKSSIENQSRTENEIEEISERKSETAIENINSKTDTSDAIEYSECLPDNENIDEVIKVSSEHINENINVEKDLPDKFSATKKDITSSDDVQKRINEVNPDSFPVLNEEVSKECVSDNLHEAVLNDILSSTTNVTPMDVDLESELTDMAGVGAPMEVE